VKGLVQYHNAGSKGKFYVIHDGRGYEIVIASSAWELTPFLFHPFLNLHGLAIKMIK
jgi:hypothetical protein